MRNVYLIDICNSSGHYETYKGAFSSKEAAEKFTSLFKQKTKIYVVSVLTTKDF